MDELNPTALEQEIYEEMELTLRWSVIRTLCGTCLRHFVDARLSDRLYCFPDRSYGTPAPSARRRGYDYNGHATDPTIPPYETKPAAGTSGGGLHITTMGGTILP